VAGGPLGFSVATAAPRASAAVATTITTTASASTNRPTSSDPKNCFGYMIELRAALFRVMWLPDGMIYDYVSERSAT
jgi:hypothetical protein